MPKKSAKTSSQSVAKPVAKPVSNVRLTEKDKQADPENYILNYTGKYVKRDSPLGKKLVEAEKTGIPTSKTMTETARLILFIQTLQDQLGLEDSEIKEALVSNDLVKAEMPRSFPNSWGGKQKNVRSPDHPKQPSNAYIFYTKSVRPSVKDKNPNLTPKEIISLMAKMWNETAEIDRVEYHKAAANDKIRYEKEMELFEAEHPDEARSKTSPGNLKPTKMTAYRLFCKDHKEKVEEEFPDFDGKQITKKLSEMWDTFKKENKDKLDEYQALADDFNKDFENRALEYVSTSPKLSKIEQAKANDPEHYEYKPITNRHVLRQGWKKNPDGSFTYSSKSGSAEKTNVVKPVPKAKSVEKVTKKIKPKKEEVETQEVDDDYDLLVE
jgi:hypothetical protein